MNQVISLSCFVGSTRVATEPLHLVISSNVIVHVTVRQQRFRGGRGRPQEPGDDLWEPQRLPPPASAPRRRIKQVSGNRCSEAWWLLSNLNHQWQEAILFRAQTGPIKLVSPKAAQLGIHLKDSNAAPPRGTLLWIEGGVKPSTWRESNPQPLC